jgi:hypothetical protein
MNILKKALLIFLFFLLSLSIGFTIQMANYTPNFNDITLKTNSTNLIVITKQIMTKYFRSYENKTVKKELRIQDFKIINIRGITGNREKLWFTMKYALKPVNMKLFSMFGMWAVKGSWIINRYACGWIIKTGQIYRIDSLDLNGSPW